MTEIPAAELSRQIQDMVTRYGFTSVFDLSSMWENTRRLRERIESGELPGPRIRTTGEGLIPPGALPSDAVLGVLGVMNFPAPEIAHASQAAAAARKLLEQGVDGIKLFASSPRSAPLPESAIRAAVAEAHQAGKPVFVHPNSGTDVPTAVRPGVDIVAHTTPHSGPWDRSILTTMQERKVAFIPTLKIWMEFMRHDRMSAQEKAAKAETGQLRAWVDAGGTVLFGTDVSYVNYDPSDEYALMAEAGMSFRQILASLTTAPAERFGDSKLGRIAPGWQADVVVLKGDPAKTPERWLLCNTRYGLEELSIGRATDRQHIASRSSSRGCDFFVFSHSVLLKTSSLGAGKSGKSRSGGRDRASCARQILHAPRGRSG